MRHTVIGVLLGCVALSAGAAELSRAVPEQLGMSSQRLARLDALLEGYIERGELAGAQIMVARHGAVVHEASLGTHDLESGAPVRADALWRIYSMTKPIATVAAMQLYERGELLLDDPVADYLPELAELKVRTEEGDEPVERPITIRQLMTHTAGFSYGFTDQGVDRLYQQAELLRGSEDLDAFIDKLAGLPLAFRPGERWHYSVAVDVLGALVERVSGQRFDRYLEEHVFEPLGMDDTFFQVPASEVDRFGTNHRYDPESEQLKVIDSPRDSRYVEDVTLFSGGGGLVSSSEDYTRFCLAMLAGGVLDGGRVLSPEAIAYMTRNHLGPEVEASSLGGELAIGPDAPLGFGLGFAVVQQPTEITAILSEGAYFWGGAAGTLFWIDPVENLAVVGMIQRMDASDRLRAEIQALTYAALIDS